MNSKLCLSLFVLLVCQGIFSPLQVQGSQLTALDFEQIDFLFPIDNEETTAALLSSADTTIVNEEEGTVNPGEEEGTTPGGEEEAGSGDGGSDIVCNDSNCSKCLSAKFGTCQECKTGYEVVAGTCETPAEPGTPAPKQTGRMSTRFRIGGTLALWNANGGATFFEANMCKLLGLKASQCKVRKVKEGSLIVDFDVYTLSSSTVTVDDLKTNLDAIGAAKDDQMNFYGAGGVIDYYGAQEAAVGGACPAGQYADANEICQACEEGCTYCDSDGKCKGANVGAIVGGILGGLALIMVIVVAYIKRDVLFKGFSSSPKSPNRAAYYAAGPVSPTEQAPLQA